MPRRFLDQRLRLSQLRMIDALDLHRSLLKAATVLGATQPALSNSLHEVEETVQARLFDRHARGVRPTEADLVVLAAGARAVLAILTSPAAPEAKRRSGPDGA
ncbi:LysR family transcriptional regulator [Methylobacterium sp. CB376]|uniref:helix-turn-helix domain-containing protein n=1 Tax=Methylobacterium sp. CB376 TaxID=3138063 RepID=UPI0024B177F0|nr:LysR family transcriptional regulator [Methylobacterium nodulans]WFT81836.1 LysR family transcriptional regulator [Methylobacterium nodulans]